MPARVRKPKDKSKVENAVLIVERWVLMRLRRETIVGLSALNTRLRELMHFINSKPLQRCKISRLELFEQYDKPALLPLPDPFILRNYKRVRIGADYHFMLDNHYYSVPYKWVHQEIDIWYDDKLVNCYYKHEFITTHEINHVLNGSSTTIEHMPPRHKKHVEWTLKRCIDWAEKIGPSTLAWVEQLLPTTHSENARHSCIGLIGLAKQYGNERLENACLYACTVNAYSRKRVLAILQNNLDSVASNASSVPKIITHKNIRGSSYYKEESCNSRFYNYSVN